MQPVHMHTSHQTAAGLWLYIQPPTDHCFIHLTMWCILTMPALLPMLLWQATLHPEHAQRTAEDLVRDLPDPDLQQLVYQDVLGIAQQLGRVLGPGPLSVKLEQLDRQSCPKWHADFVGVRCLVTYTGPGTWYVPNR
jgi:hypothetical protein